MIPFKGFGVPLFSAAMVIGAMPDASLRAQKDTSSIVGSWTLNKDLSDNPRARQEEGRGENARGTRRGGGGGGGGRGGFGRRGGGGGRRGGDGQDPGAFDQEKVARQRQALRDITEPAAHLTIVQTDSMVVVTTGEGHTTRVSPDNKKIKDDSTGVERKSRWEAGKLVSEISGLPRVSFTETYEIDPERRQLVITLKSDGRQAMTLRRVYDRD